MKTSTVISVVAALVIAGGAWYWLGHNGVLVGAGDYKSVTVTIDGQPVTLVKGYAESPAAPGSATKIVTQYFGNDATGDLNGDGLADTAFLLTQNGGGSGTFYYVVVALATKTGYEGTNAVLLGDRISPQTTEIEGGKLVVNYADRAAGAPMTTKPSIGMTKYLSVQGKSLWEIYTNKSVGFSVHVPPGYTTDEAYTYQQLGPGKGIPGVKFTIPASSVVGTNLAADTYLSVEQISKPVECIASLFLDGAKAVDVIDAGKSYSIATSSGAGAGNRYEEIVFAVPHTSPCIAVRYFIHYGVLENYPAGSVVGFNGQALLGEFDAIRHALILAQ